MRVEVNREHFRRYRLLDYSELISPDADCCLSICLTLENYSDIVNSKFREESIKRKKKKGTQG